MCAGGGGLGEPGALDLSSHRKMRQQERSPGPSLRCCFWTWPTTGPRSTALSPVACSVLGVHACLPAATSLQAHSLPAESLRCIIWLGKRSCQQCCTRHVVEDSACAREKLLEGGGQVSETSQASVSSSESEAAPRAASGCSS